MTDHCILDYKQEPWKIRCLHCGTEESINLPMPIRQVVVITNSFIDEHKHCKKVPRGIMRQVVGRLRQEVVQ